MRTAEGVREWKKRNPEKLREQKRRWSAKGGASYVKHGLWYDGRAAMVAAQGGRCCYCERPLPDDVSSVHVDHDHSCCGPRRSCSNCRRGMAHRHCNVIVGLAGEDWDLLAAIAANGRPLQAAVRERVANKPVQESLLDEVAR